MDTKVKPREKFAERKYRLESQDVVDRVKQQLPHVPIDPVRPLELIIREAVDARKLAQNNYMWLRLGEIAEQAYFNQRRYAADVWHEHCRREIMPETITTKDGTVRSKWIELPHGGTTIISTTQLEKKCFADYMTAIEAFGASLGVRFSANPRDYR